MRCLILFLLALFAISCNQEEKPLRKDGFSEVPKSREDSLFKAVIDGHDVGMAKIIRIKAALRKTQQSLDSLNKLPKSKIDGKYQQALLDLQEDLNYADYGMDTWMGEFKIDSAKGNEELRIRYLELEKEKISKITDAILSGLKRADSLLRTY